MRIAYYGLSSPLFYDYNSQGDRASSDLNTSPNPILDSALGTIMLFDELWFFCESLCPQNLRRLPYVKCLTDFINPELLFKINTLDASNLKEKIFIQNIDDKRSELFRNYSETVFNVGVRWDAAADNHTHGLKVGEKTYSGNSMNQKNIAFDLATVEILKEDLNKNISLITNSFTQSFLESSDSFLAKSHLTEHLILEDIPNYLTQNGPYHPCIEVVRENPYLIYFRNWISEKKLMYDPAEIAEAKTEIENVISESQKKIFLKYLDPKATFKSIGKTIVGAVVDNLIPYVSSAVSVIEDLKSRSDKKEMMWQGFIISAKQ